MPLAIGIGIGLTFGGGSGGGSVGSSGDQILLEEGGGYWRLEESTDQILQEE